MSMKTSVHLQKHAIPSEAIKSHFAHWLEIYPEGDDNASLTIYFPSDVAFENVEAVSKAINAAMATRRIKEDAI